MTNGYTTTPTELPSSRESEEALLGAILINPKNLNDISLEPSQFFIERHQIMYRAMRSIGPLGGLDLVSLSEVLQRQGRFEQVGGQSFILGLINKCPNAYHMDTYERIIRDTAVRREALRIASELAQSAYSMDKNINDAISILVSKLVQSAKPKGGAVEMKKFLSDLYAEISERAENPKSVHGLETGMRKFDKITHGLQKGEEFILAGQPGTGKSLLAFQLGCGMAANRHPGAVYALEMSGKAMVRRRLSAITKIKTYNMQSGVEMTDKWDKLNKGVAELEPLPIYISDATDWTTLQLRADLSRLKQQQGVDWFVLDYLDLLVDNVGRDRNEKSEYLSRQIHGICKDLSVAGLVIQSLNKGGYGSTPSMSNLSGSAKVSYDADSIAILAEDDKTNNVVNLIWEKQRESDGNNALRLVKVPGFPAFAEYTPEAAVNDYTR